MQNLCESRQSLATYLCYKLNELYYSEWLAIQIYLIFDNIVHFRAMYIVILKQIQSGLSGVVPCSVRHTHPFVDPARRHDPWLEHAAGQKICKYAMIHGRFLLVSIVFETTGPTSVSADKFLKDLASHRQKATGSKQELRRQLWLATYITSMCRRNAACTVRLMGSNVP